MRRSILPLIALALLVGCKSEAPAPAAESPPAAAEPGWKSYGEPLNATTPTALSEVLSKPGQYAGKTVYVEGSVRQACTRKGCWMELAESMDKTAPGCRVTFKDYGFFVPTNSAGAKAKLSGVVEVERVKASHVEHMEEEGATFPNKRPDGTADEVRLVATAVELKK